MGSKEMGVGGTTTGWVSLTVDLWIPSSLSSSGTWIRLGNSIELVVNPVRKLLTGINWVNIVYITCLSIDAALR